MIESPGEVLSGVEADGKSPGSDEDAVEPVELLVQLAEDGEIDPWDIDVVEVTDAFLDKLDSADIRTGGRALFYASVLLRMKSDVLLETDEEEEPEEIEPWEQAFERGPVEGEPGDGQFAGFDPVDALEEEMDRRIERKSTRGSPETLDELVRELRDAERGSWWKESREYDTSESPRGFSRGTQTLEYHGGDDLRREGEPGEGEVTGATHEEDIEAIIEEVRGRLRPHYDRGRTEVLFRELRGGDAAETPVMTYLALLFLAHRGALTLRQDDLFGDLWVREAGAPTVGDEATAD
ncbi:segregation and condensation protein A [Halorarum salinum]|uniref:Segregation/condensation protein A n=1 Tax=Halorarum salinum TaxID=2743089 RepID=A0A7D5LC18_9EURY|nr:ScpA family protein [Halobaculum salinum]QLG62971.1 segregation/condensation protein A [Halobaculum salinum]